MRFAVVLLAAALASAAAPAPSVADCMQLFVDDCGDRASMPMSACGLCTGRVARARGVDCDSAGAEWCSLSGRPGGGSTPVTVPADRNWVPLAIGLLASMAGSCLLTLCVQFQRRRRPRGRRGWTPPQSPITSPQRAAAAAGEDDDDDSDDTLSPSPARHGEAIPGLCKGISYAAQPPVDATTLTSAPTAPDQTPGGPPEQRRSQSASSWVVAVAWPRPAPP
eukprot:TRINITY_DN24859_c0_g1_i1.p2 TRINITY_DN24859_c0_g1~~TRINITY_DN24859_c0_g1_i1.p2  ORF type:complete len:222 (+),score=52.74 TRINITY_DN24859_c0_g1_i1:48-713(+)